MKDRKSESISEYVKSMKPRVSIGDLSIEPTVPVNNACVGMATRRVGSLGNQMWPAVTTNGPTFAPTCAIMLVPSCDPGHILSSSSSPSGSPWLRMLPFCKGMADELRGGSSFVPGQGDTPAVAMGIPLETVNRA